MIWVGNGQIIRVLSTLATYGVLARFLEPEHFGILSGIMMIALAANALADFGLGAAYIQRPEVDDDLLSCVFWLTIIASGMVGLIIYLSAEYIALLFELPEMTDPLRVSAAIVPLTSLRVASKALLERDLRFKNVAVADAFGTFLGSVAAIVAVLMEAGVWALVIMQLVLAGGTSIAFLFAARWIPRLYLSLSRSYELASYGSKITGSLLVMLLARNIDRPIVSRNLGADALGFYSIAFQLIEYPSKNLAQVLQRIMFPALSKIQTDNARLSRLHLNALHGVGLIIIPMMTGISVLSDDITLLLLGPGWDQTATVLALIAPIGAITAAHGLSGSILQSKNRPDLLLRCSTLTSVSVIVAILVGVQFGLFGVAAAHLTAMLLVTPIIFRVSFALIEQKITTVLIKLAPIFASSATMALAVFMLKSLLPEGALLVLIVCVPAGALAFVIAELIFDRKSLLFVLQSLLPSRFKGSEPRK